MRRVLFGVLAIVVGCAADGDDPAGETEAGSTGAPADDASGPSGGPSGSLSSSSAPSTGETPLTTSSSSSGDPSTTSGTTGTQDGSSSSTGAESECDFETVDGMIVIEGESLPVVDDWQLGMSEKGYWGEGYVGWVGEDSLGDPSNGEISVTIYVAVAGRYRLQWRNAVGIGNSSTDHNDTWVKFPDADAFYGVNPGGDGTTETRRYPRDLCLDADAMDAVQALPQVTEAHCVEGASVDGWLKVYANGGLNWHWSAFTSDSDAHEVVAEFDEPGDYTLMLAARSDGHLIDRIVIHEESIDDAIVQAENNLETACR